MVPVPGDRKQGASDRKGRCRWGFAQRDPALRHAEARSGRARASPWLPAARSILHSSPVRCGPYRGSLWQWGEPAGLVRPCTDGRTRGWALAGPAQDNILKNSHQNRFKKKKKKRQRDVAARWVEQKKPGCAAGVSAAAPGPRGAPRERSRCRPRSPAPPGAASPERRPSGRRYSLFRSPLAEVVRGGS